MTISHVTPRPTRHHHHQSHRHHHRRRRSPSSSPPWPELLLLLLSLLSLLLLSLLLLSLLLLPPRRRLVWSWRGTLRRPAMEERGEILKRVPRARWFVIGALEGRERRDVNYLVWYTDQCDGGLLTFSYFSFSFAAFFSKGCLSSEAVPFHISPSLLATSPMVRPGVSPFTFWRYSAQKMKKADLGGGGGRGACHLLSITMVHSVSLLH